MNPIVSVVIPLYNKQGEIRRAICSVINQAFRDFELIVVDDGSTDSSLKVVSEIRDPRMRIVSQPNAGVSAARNRGIELAHAELIAFLDADDEWHPDFLKTVWGLVLKYPECSVFATSYYIANTRKGARRAVLRGLPPEFSEGVIQSYFQVASQSDPPLFSSAIAVRGAAIRAINGFPEGVTTGEDLLTWAKLAVKCKIAYSIQAHSTFWEPEKVTSRPGRVPENPDRVGKGLRQLVEEYADNLPTGLVAYVALWYRMRGVIFLQLADSRNARMELKQAMRIAGPSPKLLVLFLISLFPGGGARLLYHTMKDINIGNSSRA